MTTTTNKLTGMMVLAFCSKAVKSGVKEDKDVLLCLLSEANILFANNYDSNESILQKQFISKCEISIVNNVPKVSL